MSDDKKFNVDNINYAVYKLGDWKNNYEINQIGLSHEIPVTEPTITHVKLSMDEVRKSEFDISDKTVNGFVAIALQLNPKVQNMELEDVIDLEQKEFDAINDELDNLELLAGDISLDIDDENYLIYKLEKECHVTIAIPANDHTKEFYKEEMKRIDDAVMN